jgi:DNA-directed RNA polymerase subunit RPC12/RpoP
LIRDAMNDTDSPRPPRRIEVFEVTCWRCARTVDLPVSLRPYRCLACGALLLIEWR